MLQPPRNIIRIVGRPLRLPFLVQDGSVRRDLDLEMVYLNLVNLLTGGVNFRILIDEATQMKIIRSSAEILLYYVKNSGR